MILIFGCGKEFLLQHPAAVCLSTTAAVLTWDSWLYPCWESHWYVMKLQWYTPYSIHLGFLLSNLCCFCSNLLLAIHAGWGRTCSHQELRWATPCSGKPSHTPGRRVCAKRQDKPGPDSSKAPFSRCSPKRLMMEGDSLTVSEQTVPKQRKGSLFHPSHWSWARYIQTLFPQCLHRAQSYPELCPPYAPPVITALGVKVLAASPQALWSSLHPSDLPFVSPTVVIGFVSASEENSSLHKQHPFPVSGQNITLSFCKRSGCSPCSSWSTVACVCNHLSNSRKQISLKCPEWVFSSIYWWLTTLQQWGVQSRNLLLLQAEITRFSTASRSLAAHTLSNTCFHWEWM